MIWPDEVDVDTALEESARVWRFQAAHPTLTDLPLVRPGCWPGATLCVFAERLGSFAAARVIGIPGPQISHHHRRIGIDVSYPPDTAALGDGLRRVIVMCALAPSTAGRDRARRSFAPYRQGF